MIQDIVQLVTNRGAPKKETTVIAKESAVFHISGCLPFEPIPEKDVLYKMMAHHNKHNPHGNVLV